MRWLWLRRVDPSRPWFCLPDEKEGVVELMFQASIYVVLGDGNGALFWSDRWLDGQSLMDIAPCLCNAVGPRIRSKRTVAQALQGGQWIRDITGALTVQVLLEYLQFGTVWGPSSLANSLIKSAGGGPQIEFFLLPRLQGFFHWPTPDCRC